MVDQYDEPGSGAPLPEGQGQPIGEPAEGHEALFKQPQPAPRATEDGSRHPFFPIALGAVMVLILAIAWIMNAKPKEQGPASTSPAAPADTAAAPAAEKPAEPSPDSTALKAELDGLKNDLKALQDRIEALPKPGPPVELGPLNSKISDLAKQTEALASLPKKVDDLDHRLAALDTTLTTVRSDLDTVKSEVKKVAEATPATPAAAPEAARPAAAGANTADTAIEQAAAPFKAGKYKEAADAFQKLTETYPDDARVWYFAALSRGSATNQWTGETTRMVEKAVALEKAGNPQSAKIDAAFADLNPSFRPWLDAYRKMAKAR
jgi:TolA-binding protein